MRHRPFSHRRHRRCRCHRHHRRSYQSQRRELLFRKTMCTRRVFLRKWYSNLSLLLNVRWQFEFLSFWQHQWCPSLFLSLHVCMWLWMASHSYIMYTWVCVCAFSLSNIRYFMVGSRFGGKLFHVKFKILMAHRFPMRFFTMPTTFALSIAFHGNGGYHIQIHHIHTHTQTHIIWPHRKILVTNARLIQLIGTHNY